MTQEQTVLLKDNDHVNNVIEDFKEMLSTQAMADVTLACDSRSLKAHKFVLSACSPFLKTLLEENPCPHPILILTGVKYSELAAIVEFMYHGEINVNLEHLPGVIKVGETLKIRGISAELLPTLIKAGKSSSVHESPRTMNKSEQKHSHDELPMQLTSMPSAHPPQEIIEETQVDIKSEQNDGDGVFPSTSSAPSTNPEFPDIIVIDEEHEKCYPESEPLLRQNLTTNELTNSSADAVSSENPDNLEDHPVTVTDHIEDTCTQKPEVGLLLRRNLTTNKLRKRKRSAVLSKSGRRPAVKQRIENNCEIKTEPESDLLLTQTLTSNHLATSSVGCSTQSEIQNGTTSSAKCASTSLDSSQQPKKFIDKQMTIKCPSCKGDLIAESSSSDEGICSLAKCINCDDMFSLRKCSDHDECPVGKEKEHQQNNIQAKSSKKKKSIINNVHCPHRNCQYSTPFKCNMEKHKLTRKHLGPYTCEACGEKFQRKNSYRKHVQMEHRK